MDVVVGRVAKAHGVTGELAVDVRTDSPEERFAVGSVLSARLRDGTVRALTVAAARPHAGRLLVRFDEVLTRDVAETLRGTLLVVDADSLPPPEDPDEFYDHDLEGLTAVLADGTPVGTVREVLHVAGSDLLVVERPEPADPGAAQAEPAEREVLVPFVRDIVPEVNITEGRVVLTPPEGLLD
ncbi:ribosome maturation factor RimM [Goodfellowiella coeruleoviolacea]|uniref:Ribosome maturation factor RimM n=1 Tax=Goodfellowiella coeruleoviolacea TaxID=334858 RepID=A0AAE3GBT0_9PSEU|nr:ribosome maturation factor RimM [Goodfellowiella coeruleoviolacea]MCP2165392.1 16S rRNA processing protein RimM [Goodfellowiella coeruleoviolacea]